MIQRSLLVVLAVLPLVYCLFDTLSEQQLLHLFGTASKANAPRYWIDVPSKGFDAGGLYYVISLNGESYHFRLSKYEQLISPGFHSVLRNGASEELFEMNTECIYRGESISHNDTSIAVVGCGPRMRGLIVSNGDHFLVHPHFTTSVHSHIIHKRSVESHTDSCAINAKDDPFPEDRIAKSVFERIANRLAIIKEHELMVELAVFIDDALWMHFQKLYGIEADAELQKFVLAVVNNIDALYQHSSIEPKIRVKITRFEVMKIPPVQMSRNMHSSGDVDRLLDVFCKYQNELNPSNDTNPKHWDHALLFSGYDLYRGSTRTIAGYAAVKGMCTEKRSCTINEGLDFGSVFVVTHEMGHSLGMYHDGDNRCDLRCCIMSPSVGSGKTSWSECSVRELNNFVTQLGQKGRPKNCLIDGTHPPDDPPLNVPSGQQFTLDEQCAFFHGECWRHELKEGQKLSDVCDMVWCGNGEGIVRSAHPALQGSFCGEQKWCIEGKCVETTLREAPKVNGGWSAWSDVGSRSCSIGCVKCSIAGQIRVRRSSRHCNKPYPNNGGHDCRGDSARGIRCDEERCSGITADEYATQECTKQRDKDAAYRLHLSGKGYQYEEDLCKIWCVLPGDRIRTMSNFPDGTPCGNDRYCIKGHCRPLLCGGRAIVASEDDCPFRALRDDIIDARNGELYLDKVLTRTRTTHRKRLNGIWSSWSSWGGCAAIQCRKLGIRVRQRSCTSGVCVGANRQRSSCFVPCAHSHNATNSKTTHLSQSGNVQHHTTAHRLHIHQAASASHGTAAQRSTNVVHLGHNQSTTGNTSLLHHTSTRPTTGALRSTTKPHGGSIPRSAHMAHLANMQHTASMRNSKIMLQQDTKLPYHTTVAPNGRNVSPSPNVPHRKRVQTATAAIHVNALRRTTAHITTALKSRSANANKLSRLLHTTTTNSAAERSPWSAWSVCSASCGTGMQSRKKCTQCEKSIWEVRRCSRKECEAEWTQWGVWGSCDATCGRSNRYRRRRCVGSTCKGSAVSTMQCAVPPCPVSVTSAIGSPPYFRQFAPIWSSWSAWSACSATCGGGIKRRVRVCSFTRQCVGISSNIRICSTAPCLAGT